MPINAGYEYLNAEKAYLQAKTLEEKIVRLEELIRHVPGHKGAENLRAELRSRLKKLLEKKEKGRKIGKSTHKSIKKEGYQCALVGLTNSGKSSLLSKLTNAKPRVDSYQFTTKNPEIGTLDYEGVKVQIIDLPSIGSENFDIGITNTADCLIIVVEKIEDIEQIEKYLVKSYGKKIIAINKVDKLDYNELRKLQEKIKSKKLNAITISCESSLNLEELKRKIFESMNIIRVYTKEPGKSPSNLPIVLQKESCVKDVAEKILKGFSQKVKETRVTGPSSKFPNQKVGLSHILKDRDIVEFHTK